MRVAIYARVSVKHKNRKDMTIQAQIEVCRQFLAQVGGYREAESFCDVGYSGKTMERPAFQRLLQEIQKETVDIVVAKDFSRIGRNYREVGNFVEKIIPQYHVRLLTVSEHFDSEANHCVTAAGFFHLLNEWYLHDLSRKVSVVKREKKQAGNYLGSRAPYGYRIVSENGIRKIEQEKSYVIVQKICDLSQRGYSSEEIVKELYKERINPPKCYYQSGKLHFEQGKEKYWQSGTIRKLLKREQ